MQLKYQSKQKAILLLEDGKVFEGKAAGKIGTTTGEICFNTGMTGYQEIFTDPSYFGQIVIRRIKGRPYKGSNSGTIGTVKIIQSQSGSI